jgi:GntR family transcriptional repressor for pyruvate dehydrogenase complex
MFQNASQGKRSVFIINQIRESILKGRLKPGDRLPSEHNLMNQFGVSRFTLREALLSLETMGFIEVRKGAGGGPVVKQVTMNVAREAISHFLHFQDVSIRDLSEVRKLVEPYLASQMADKLSDEDIEYLESLNEACSRTLDRGEEIIGGEQEIDFHIHLARATGNSVLIMIMDFVNKLLAESKLSVKPGPEFSRRVVQAHQRIIDALKSRDGEAAAQAMYDHVAEVEEEMHKLRASQS